MDVDLRLRHPKWADGTPTVRINGRTVDSHSRPGSYFTLRRTWSSGDTIEIEYPMSLHTEPLPGDPQKIAVLYGPIVLAGALGTDGMLEGVAYAKDHPTYTGADLFISDGLRRDRQPYAMETPRSPRRRREWSGSPLG